jgi:hypothetical protein
MEISCFFPTTTHSQASPIINIPHQSVSSVTVCEPTLTYHHLESIVDIGVTLYVVHYIGLDKCIMTLIYHYNTTQNMFSALKNHFVFCFFPITANH